MLLSRVLLLFVSIKTVINSTIILLVLIYHVTCIGYLQSHGYVCLSKMSSSDSAERPHDA